MRRIRLGFCLLALGLLISSCKTTAVITDELTPAELIQRAQEASDRNRYKIALQYYEALQERALLGHYDYNLDYIITSEYEIAFIHYKQKKYQQSREEMNALLERFNTPDEELLPTQFKKLAKIVIERIDEREKPRGKKSAGTEIPLETVSETASFVDEPSSFGVYNESGNEYNYGYYEAPSPIEEAPSPIIDTRSEAPSPIIDSRSNEAPSPVIDSHKEETPVIEEAPVSVIDTRIEEVPVSVDDVEYNHEEKEAIDDNEYRENEADDKN